MKQLVQGLMRGFSRMTRDCGAIRWNGGNFIAIDLNADGVTVRRDCLDETPHLVAWGDISETDLFLHPEFADEVVLFRSPSLHLHSPA